MTVCGKFHRNPFNTHVSHTETIFYLVRPCRWPLTLKTLSAMPTYMINIHWRH